MKVLVTLLIFFFLQVAFSGQVSCIADRETVRDATVLTVEDPTFDCDGQRILAINCKKFAKCSGKGNLQVELHVTDNSLYKEYDYVCLEKSKTRKLIRETMRRGKNLYPAKLAKKIMRNKKFENFFSTVGERCKMIKHGRNPKQRVFDQFFTEYLPKYDQDGSLKKILDERNKQIKKDFLSSLKFRAAQLLIKPLRKYNFKKDKKNYLVVNTFAFLATYYGRCKATDVEKLLESGKTPIGDTNGNFVNKEKLEQMRGIAQNACIAKFPLNCKDK